MKRPSLPASLILLAAVFHQGCSVLQPLPASAIAQTTDCGCLFEQMDRLVAEHGVGDADAARVEGFPELRVDRFLASFAKDNPAGKDYTDWFERLRRLGETARLIEWRNLPPEAVSRFRASSGLNVETALRVCGHILSERDLISAGRRSDLLATVEPPDAYSSWQRVLGLYYLSRWAVVDGVKRVHREMREPFANPERINSASGRWLGYEPPTSGHLNTGQVAEILERSASTPLAIPEPSARELDLLFSTFAPAWLVDTRNGSDRIGTVRFGANETSGVDTTRPSVYRLASHTRFEGQVLLQLNYLIWFPARPAASRLDIYAGRFDGLIWRVTLRKDGRPLAYDSIHPCGCYYQIFPGEGLRVVQPGDGSEPILSPMPIAAPKPDERLTIRLSAGNHFILAVDSEMPMPEASIYGWLDYDALRSLALPDGRRRSMFDEDGLVRGSERLERFLLWPMGIPSAGAMRQWGSHAIAFVGKRHFDDPRLMEKLLKPLWE